MSTSWNEIHARLMATSSKLRFQRAFEVIRQEHLAPHDFVDPVAVLDVLHRRDLMPSAKNQILMGLAAAAKLDAAQADEASVLLLLALWPGLDAIRRRALARRRWFHDELSSELLFRATEGIRGVNLESVEWVAATLLRNIERDMTRRRRRERELAVLEGSSKLDDIAEQPRTWSHRQMHQDLRRLLGGDARLVIRVAVEGYTQAEASTEIGVASDAGRKRYQRAIAKLREHLEDVASPMSRSAVGVGLYPIEAAARGAPAGPTA